MESEVVLDEVVQFGADLGFEIHPHYVVQFGASADGERAERGARGSPPRAVWSTVPHDRAAIEQEQAAFFGKLLNTIPVY
jgi:hypothetical protein